MQQQLNVAQHAEYTLFYKYRIHSNKHPGCLDQSFRVDAYLFQSIFVARINPRIDDFGHFQADF